MIICVVVGLTHAKTTWPAIAGTFDERQRCPACLLFTTQLHYQMKKRCKTSETGEALKKYLAREDRIDELIEATIASCMTDFTWLDANQKGTEKLQRYWSIKNMRARQMLTDDLERLMEARAMAGGSNLGFSHFLNSVVANGDETEEAVREIVKANGTDVRGTIRRVCVTGSKVCPRGVSKKKSVMHPTVEDGGDGMTDL